jgi:hypothetical protein
MGGLAQLAAGMPARIHALGDDYAFADAYNALAHYWKSRGIPALDVFTAYEGGDLAELRVNARDAHPNESSNELAAKAILPFLDGHVAASDPAGPMALPR